MSIHYVKSLARYKFITKFHSQLQSSVSHYMHNENSSERLLRKYCKSLFDIKKFCEEEFGIKVLQNLDLLTFPKDPVFSNYYINIANSLKSQVNRKKIFPKSRYYIVKKMPFIVEGEIFYEINYVSAYDNASKFNRLVAFTKSNIPENYSLKFIISEDYINVNNINIPIVIIENWHISIRPCELNWCAKIFGINKNINSKSREYTRLMYILRDKGITLVDFIDMDDEKYAKYKNEIISGIHNVQFMDIVDHCRRISKVSGDGINTIRYLLYKLRNIVIKKQYCVQECARLSSLHLQYACIPFETMPFASSLVKHNPSIHDLIECIDDDGRDHEFFARKIYMLSVNEKKIYHKFSDEKYSEYTNFAKIFNSLCYIKHTNRHILEYNKLFYIQENKTSLLEILHKLNLLAESGDNSYTNSTIAWIIANNIKIDDAEKYEIIKKMFSASRVALIYGAAGTGKTTLLNYIAMRYCDVNKVFLSVTNPSVENLRRRIHASNSNFMTIERFLNSSNKEYDIIFIDECSTVSNIYMKKILCEASFQAMILVGDVFQIEAIDFGNWFLLAKHFIKSGAVFELTNLFRTTNEKIKLLWDKVRCADNSITELIVRENMTSTLDESIFVKQEVDEIILCLNYDGLYGINNINKLVQENNPNQAFRCGDAVYKVGDPVLFTENNQYNKVLHNNLKGVIKEIHINDGRIAFHIEIEKVFDAITLNRTGVELLSTTQTTSVIRLHVPLHDIEDDSEESSNIPPFQVAYALSIHKAQGLEYDSVKIVIAENIDELITHNIFYTAITRCRNNIKIYWSAEAQNNIISSFYGRSDNRDLLIIKNELLNTNNANDHIL